MPGRSNRFDVGLSDSELLDARRDAYAAARRVGASYHEAEDHAQECVLRALTEFAQGRLERANVRYYVRGVAKKIVPTVRRSDHRRGARERWFASTQVESVDEIERTLGVQWVLDQVGRAGLSPRQRECALMAVRGFSTNEIAAKLGLTAGTVRTHLGHAWQALRDVAESNEDAQR